MTVPSKNVVATSLFFVVACIVGGDLLSDAGSGVEWMHVALEAAAACVAVAGAVVFYRHHRSEVAELSAWKAEAQELLRDAGGSVERQFETWDLSPAEREVALLLLKGLSFKEIAAVRDTSERTGREQARAVYRKAGVSGRAELSAWFIEDLIGGP
jgi:DNA-binding CsgD family transcriptional regulator